MRLSETAWSPFSRGAGPPSMCSASQSTKRRRTGRPSWRIISIWTSSPPATSPIHTKGESNREYLQISQALEELLLPVFRFTDKGDARAVTITDLAFKTVDKVLHATFTLSFRDSDEEPVGLQLMEELESTIKDYGKE